MHNIHQITPMLHVPNCAEALHFFEHILKFEVLFKMDGYFYCQREGAGVRVLEEDEGSPAPKHSHRVTVYCDCHNVDALYAELQTALATLPEGKVVPPKDYSWNQREFHVEMPDGNFLAFGQEL
jgi:uncharacterized glyoxalase superfamily protein PhnB